MKKYSYPETGIRPELITNNWVNKKISKEPIYLASCLRDGNQALPTTMSQEEKLEYFKMLVSIGFKEIEVSFPSADPKEYEFTRTLIEGGHIPDDVTISVLVPCREDLIETTFQSLSGVKKAIVHFYIASSDIFMKKVLKKSKSELIATAEIAARKIKKLAGKMPNSNIRFEFSPEHFTSSSADFCLKLCENVYEACACPKDMIFNLPATVQTLLPHQFACLVEYFEKNFKYRKEIIISVHVHNDKGLAVANSELAILAGAERIEGTLFGNGERAGNADLLVLALNLYTAGIDISLNFSNMTEIVKKYESLTKMSVHPRHPYAGKLVHTSFSGTHQDAIEKVGFGEKGEKFFTPYLIIDPSDIGESYEAVIRISTQSGKGGIKAIFKQKYQIDLPDKIARSISLKIKEIYKNKKGEIRAEQCFQIFEEYIVNQKGKYEIKSLDIKSNEKQARVSLEIIKNSITSKSEAEGEGHLEAFVLALKKQGINSFEILNYYESSMSEGIKSQAISFVCLKMKNGNNIWGAGLSRDITQAPCLAVVSALNTD